MWLTSVMEWWCNGSWVYFTRQRRRTTGIFCGVLGDPRASVVRRRNAAELGGMAVHSLVRGLDRNDSLAKVGLSGRRWEVRCSGLLADRCEVWCFGLKEAVG